MAFLDTVRIRHAPSILLQPTVVAANTSNHIILYLYLYVTWQYALLCYRATGGGGGCGGGLASAEQHMKIAAV